MGRRARGPRKRRENVSRQFAAETKPGSLGAAQRHWLLVGCCGCGVREAVSVGVVSLLDMIGTAFTL